MKKGAKKKNRKLRRQVRKTVGALFMASAIVVAAIPVQDISAYPSNTGRSSEKIKVAVTSEEGEIKAGDAEYGYASQVPYAQKSTDQSEKIVYTSGDGMFQFAYTYISNTNRGAVILQFDNVNGSDTITIPKEIEAYRKYAPNYTNQGYCLVSLNDELLGYREQEQLTTDSGELRYITRNRQPGTAVENIELLHSQVLWDDDDKPYHIYNKVDEHGNPLKDKDGNIITARCEVEPLIGWKYYPCYYDQRSRWGDKPDEQLFYLPKKDDGSGNKVDDYGNWQPATSNEHWRIVAAVSYIGAEKIVENDTGWEVKGYRVGPDDGVFANRPDITNLVIEGSLRGISDYAFYNCRTLSSVEFKSGLNTLGNGAFAGCRQLTSVTIPRNAQIQAIGKDAFYDCQSLKDFIVPDGLEALGDCAFEGCIGLETVNLLGSGRPVSLQRLGNHLFRGCEHLAGIEFPNSYSEILDIDMFEGCKALQYIKLPDTTSGSTIDFKCLHKEDMAQSTNYPNCANNTWQKFRETVPDSFYFEGPSVSAIHTTANDNSITYKYPNEELYEKVVFEHDAYADDSKCNPQREDGKYAKTIYQVNNSGELVKFDILPYEQGVKDSSGSDLKGDSHPDIITIPEKIGAFGIKSIGAGSFNNNCDLTKVTIPASVTEIGADAFKGCHKLETIMFTDASTIKSIGPDAFRTQVAACSDNLWPSTGVDKPKLYFVGAMLNAEGEDTETFKYAMNGSSKINQNSTEDIWITCHSGWPTNLEVQYNYDPRTQEGEAQLVGYPRFGDLNTVAKATEWVKKLPYVVSSDVDDVNKYTTMIDRAIRFNAGGLGSNEQALTPDEQAFLAATLNLVIPASVDSIKPGLFSGYTYDEKGDPISVSGNDISGTDIYIKSILINGVTEIEPYTFKGCTALQRADVIGSSIIDNYAFEECTGLKEVTIGSNLKDTGKRPFKGCDGISNINCLDPSNFVYNSGILYRKIGNSLEIVECLENRGALNGTGLYNVGPDELTGVTSIKDEAFADCTEIGQIDMSKTTVDIIPEGCFKDMQLSSIVLPSSLLEIEKDAFRGNNVNRLIVYFKGDPTHWEDDQFEPKDPTKQVVIFQCLEKSNADRYAGKYSYINSSDEEVYLEFEVIFWNLPDWPNMNNQVLVDKQTVRAGEDAVPPKENPTCNNSQLSFAGWSNYENIQKDTDVFAQYDSPEFKVEFIDGYSYTVLKTEYVKYGQSATPPAEETLPKYEGQMFVGWDKEYYNITSDITIIAKYVDSSGDANRHKVTFYDDDGKELFYQYVNDGDAPLPAQAPVKAGYTFVKWVWTPPESATSVKQDTSVVAQYERGGNNSGGNNPGGSPGPSGSANPSGSGNQSGSASPSASPSSSPEVTKYTVSVAGGSGSGRYAAGEIVAVNAYYMGEGQAFDRWTSSTAGVGFSNPNATSATFTMPAANVAITATYKTGSGTASNSAGGGSGAGAGGSSGGSGTTSNNGTTVEVTKPGISNTNYAGATVSGATDNFIVKVTEDQSATDAVIAALQARYGDISRIQYLPMDISLYDSTGRTRIADTTGITVNLTLPLPDDLVQYAGNNKVAAISNGALEDLNVRFTTVGGVPCVNFTATHFSPYVIYVDTANLTEATIDTTPKTGDPIHPKWFLALGMACISLVLFFKRDKVVVKSKTA